MESNLDEFADVSDTDGANDNSIRVVLGAVSGSILGNVLEDTNYDNVGEVGLANEVILRFGNDWSFIASTLTNSDDNDEFVGLPA